MTDMKPFGELSDAEKGALLLAHHEGKRIDERDPTGRSMGWRRFYSGNFGHYGIYRIAPEPLIPDSINWDKARSGSLNTKSQRSEQGTVKTMIWQILRERWRLFVMRFKRKRNKRDE